MASVYPVLSQDHGAGAVHRHSPGGDRHIIHKARHDGNDSDVSAEAPGRVHPVLPMLYIIISPVPCVDF